MSQCSGRVKHALSPRPVSPGLFLGPRPSRKSRPVRSCRFVLARKRTARPQTMTRGAAKLRTPSPSFPSGFTCSDRKNAQHLCGYMTLYIGHAARHFTRTRASSRSPYTNDLCIPILASALQDPLYSAGPHGLAATDAAKFTKSTQIGHKLCSNRRNWGHLPACFAFHA